MSDNASLNFKAALFILLSAVQLCGADVYSFATLPPDGVVAGDPGSTVGWGYSITNSSSLDWLVTTSLSTDPFLSATPNLLFDFPVIDPGATVSVPYNSSIGTGLLELVWDSSAPVGFSNSGDFTLSAEWWTDNPFSGGTFITSADDSSQPYVASVAGVPEPPTPSLLFLGLVLVLAFRYCRFDTRNILQFVNTAFDVVTFQTTQRGMLPLPHCGDSQTNRDI